MMRFLLSLLTVPLSAVWYVMAVVRGKLFDWGIFPSETFGVPTICVGNIAVGGTGKTPHVEYILRLLHDQGYRVAMLSRGYGRQTRGYVLADGTRTAAEIGDEPFQISRNCPYATVAVCEKRVTGIRHLLQLRPRPEVIVLDDAYQHRYVRAGLNILLTEASRLYTHDHLLPWGRLREPAGAACRADAVVVTKCTAGQRPVLPVAPRQQLYYSRIDYTSNYPLVPSQESVSQSYAGRAVLLIAGIAHPEPLRTYIEQQGAIQVQVLAFPDHHNFVPADYSRMQQAWQQLQKHPGGTLPPLAVTTQKDASRLAHQLQALPEDLKNQLYVQPIGVRVTEAEAGQETFNLMILNYVSKNSRNSGVD